MLLVKSLIEEAKTVTQGCKVRRIAKNKSYEKFVRIRVIRDVRVQGYMPLYRLDIEGMLAGEPGIFNRIRYNPLRAQR